MMWNIENDIRTIAKRNYWQVIYTQSKEVGLKVFHNDTNFTHMQIAFLNYLAFYSSLSLDIAMGEVEEFVRDDPIYEDSYMFFRQKSRGKKKPPPSSQKEAPPEKVETSKWVFRKPAGE